MAKKQNKKVIDKVMTERGLAWRKTWTLCLQLGLVSLVGMIIILFEVVAIIPGAAVSLLDAVGITNASSTLSLFAVWAAPLIFLVLLLAAATVSFFRWFWAKLSEIRSKLCIPIGVKTGEEK